MPPRPRPCRRLLRPAIRRRPPMQKAPHPHPRRDVCLLCICRPVLLPNPRPISTSAHVGKPRLLHATGQERRVTAVMTTTKSDDRDPIIGPMQEYDRRVAEGRIRDDEFQREIIRSLQRLHDELARYKPGPVRHPTPESLKPSRSLLGSLFGRSTFPRAPPLPPIPLDLPRGLYLYGDVGSGKTMMMDLFYDTLPPAVGAKTRIHFHHFMQDVHRRLHRVKLAHGGAMDAVPFVAADLAAAAGVLCFDEFQCTDVADAMILRRLLEALMAHGVVLVTTSNRHPDELYKNGVQRASFVPAIQLLKRRLHVLNLDSPTDYRRLPRPASGVYHTPLDQHAAAHAQRWFRFLGDPVRPDPRPETQHVWGRDIVVPRASGPCAWFTFAELIGRALGPADYLELARAYAAFVVTDVPRLTLARRDLARRFITFIDAVYESQAKLVLTTAVPLPELFMSPEETNLFSGDEEAFAFARALSRLAEMGSREWVERRIGPESRDGKKERDDGAKVRSRQKGDSM